MCIAIGIVLGVGLARRRWAARGGDPDDISAIAVWAVPAGIVGARLYHVITDWRPFGEWYKVWEGGLGIPGGLIAGVAVGVWAGRRRGLDLGELLDAAIPGIPVAQAVGRIGNWFNQELYGGPTDLPWGVEIDDAHRPLEYRGQDVTFHPAFLYEASWNLALVGLLIWVDRRGWLRRGMILPLYVLGYGIGRFLVESVRIDPATDLLGIRVNHWMSGLAVVLAVAALAMLWRRGVPSYFANQASGEEESPDADHEAASSG